MACLWTFVTRAHSRLHRSWSGRHWQRRLLSQLAQVESNDDQTDAEHERVRCDDPHKGDRAGRRSDHDYAAEDIRSEPGDQPEDGGLACPVRTDQAVIVPRRTSKEHLSTACRPPKDLLTERTSRSTVECRPMFDCD